MKKTICLLIAFFCFFAITQKALGQQTTQTSGLYMVTPKFGECLSQLPVGTNEISRRDSAWRLVLDIVFGKDGVVNVDLYDYDNSGNMTSHVLLDLIQDKKNKLRYNYFAGLPTNTQFAAITKKIINRLNE
jgi:hypothetical protein